MRTIFVTSFDENYFEYSKVPMRTLSRWSSGPHEVVCLVPPDLMPREKEYADSIPGELQIKFMCADRFYEIKDTKSNGVEYLTANMNHRIFMGSMLKDYDKAIYFDPDTIFIRNPEAMIEMPMTHKLHALQEYLDQAGVSFDNIDRPYFNNGVFIADLNFWREFNAEQKLLDYILNHPESRCPDQDAMNAVFFEEWGPLPVTFNSMDYLYYKDTHISRTNQAPVIVHFIGPNKPWIKTITEWSKRWKEEFENVKQSY